jgi:YD repeat-containing protein
VLSVTDPRNLTTSYGYDALNQQTVEIDANGTSIAATTTTVYDKVGNVLSVTDPRGLITSYAYDAMNRQTVEIDAKGTTVARTTTTCR